MVPEGTCGCGRGTRSFKHRLETGCIIHDASYWCSIELLGPMKEILPILSDLSNYTSPEYVGEERSSHQHADVPGSNGSCCTGPLEIVTCESSRVIIWAHCEYAAPVIRNVCEKVKKSDNISMKLGRLGRIEVRGPVSERIISKLGDEGRRRAPLTIENHNDPSLGDNCIWSMYDRINKKQVIYSASDLSNGLSDIVSGLVGYCVCSEPRGRECASSDDSITIAVIRNSSGVFQNCISLVSSGTFTNILPCAGFSIYLNRDIYQVIFKAICLSGAFIAGQREWHWYHTLNKLAFYPNDYSNSHQFGKIVETFAARLDKNENFPSNLMRQSQALFSRSERLSRVAIWILKNGTLRQGDILCAIESPKILPSCGKMRIDSQRSLIRKGESTVAAKKDIHRWDVMGIVTSARPHGMNSKYPSIGLVASGSLPLMGKKKIVLWAWAQDRQLIAPVLVKIMS